jgi:type VII secretion-associated serine protease mycosin
VAFAAALPATRAHARQVTVPTAVNCAGLPATSLDHAVPWPQRRLDFQRVWPVTQGAGITVAVVDTGVDAQQPFLRGAVLPGVDVINGGGTANTDCDGHGTFVAGIIAGRTVPGFGFAGVAPEATILPIRQANATTDGTALSLAEGIRAAVDAHARVINVSIVTARPTLVLANAVRYAQAHDVVIVAAAGNDFAHGNAVQYPAGFPGVLAVGAVDSSGRRAGFSETGPDISVVAPGANLLGPGAGGVGLVTAAGGTSFAAPFVAGVAALVRAYRPALTAAQVIARIEATADHPAGTLPDPGLGWGEVNPYAAVTAVLPSERSDATAPARPGASAPAHPSRASGQSRRLSVELALAGGALVVLVLLAAGFIVRRGRPRRRTPHAIRDHRDPHP